VRAAGQLAGARGAETEQLHIDQAVDGRTAGRVFAGSNTNGAGRGARDMASRGRGGTMKPG